MLDIIQQLIASINALGTLIIATLVCVITYRQWQTAHQKVILDLFDRRMRIIEDVRRVIAAILQGGKSQSEDSDKFLRATKGADFLFGPEVNDYLKSVHGVLLDLHVCDAERDLAQGEARQNLFKKRRELRDQLHGFFHELDELVAPYVRMDQKL